MRLVIAAVLLVGCQLNGASGTLPTYDPGSFCSLAELFPAAVHVDPDADPPTWVDQPNGARTHLEWPTGFSIRVNGEIAEVVDPDGFVVVTDGDPLAGVGGGVSARGEEWFAVCSIGDKTYVKTAP